MADLQKLTIHGYKEDPNGRPRNLKGGTTFTAMINPEKIVHNKSIKWNDNNAANATSPDVKQFQGYGVENLSFDLIIDGTGVAHNKTVDEQLETLHGVVYDYQGAIHKPHYVVVNWNKKYGFKGHLSEMSVEYNLFDTEGNPLRAKVTLKFINHVNRKAYEAGVYNRSPDMSHLRTMRDGDSLPLICDEIYHEMGYYVQIAELNNLTNFRNIRMGTELMFPPLINE